MIKQLKLSALLVALLASVSTFSVADTYATKGGYSADVPTDAVSRNNYGECWKTTYTADNPVPVECGGDPGTQTITEREKYRDVITLSADVLFAFDKADLRPQATGILNEAIAKGRQANAQLDRVIVVGHTDSIGSDKYNDALSLRRANTVRSYLVNNTFPADQVVAEGRGKREAQMTAQCGQEVSKLGRISAAKKRTALIACLQPDRRVDIVFEGSIVKERTIQRTISK